LMISANLVLLVPKPRNALVFERVMCFCLCYELNSFAYLVFSRSLSLIPSILSLFGFLVFIYVQFARKTVRH
jgi:hypothetical protein